MEVDVVRLETKSQKVVTSSSKDSEPYRMYSPSAKYNFSVTDILDYLYKRCEVKSANIDGTLPTAPPGNKSNLLDNNCTSCDQHPDGKCSKHKHLETLRILKSPDKNHQNISRALRSFPAEVELCTSSIPGNRYGVRALQTIPEGTWIGPYEGKRTTPDDVTPDTDTSFMWEIFKEGDLAYYLDASDANQSSWMRYIGCARYKDEQNTSVMQYVGNIYYRVYKKITPGQEILVWYDEACPHFLGIPLKMQDIAATSTTFSRVSTPEATAVPVRPSLPLKPNTGIPVVSGAPRQAVLTPFMQARHSQAPFQQFQLSPLVGIQMPLPGYQVIQPSMSRGLLVQNSIGNTPDYRQQNNGYTKTPLYSNGFPYMNNTDKPTNTINSNRVKPYSRDIHLNQSKPSLSDTMTNQSHFNLKKPDLDQNGNVKISPKLHETPRDITLDTCKEKYYMKRSQNKSTDSTVNKFLFQIEEARIEQLKKKQSQASNKEIVDPLQTLESDLELSIWKCGQCEQSFAQQQILQIHICPCIPEKPYTCTYCSEIFAQPSELRTHAVIHNGRKPFKCGFCARLFAGSTTLNNHIRTHTGERPFGCEKCGKDFTQASQLSRHRRTIFECL